MYKRQPVAEALGAASAASEIRIGGWVRTRRDAKGFSFLELNDGSCLGNIQCIVDEGTAAWDKLEGVNTGACVAVTGELVESPGKGQKWEVREMCIRDRMSSIRPGISRSESCISFLPKSARLISAT